MMNWPLRKRNDGARVVRKLNRRSVQWRTLMTLSRLKLLIEAEFQFHRAAAQAARTEPELAAQKPWDDLRRKVFVQRTTQPVPGTTLPSPGGSFVLSERYEPFLQARLHEGFVTGSG